MQIKIWIRPTSANDLSPTMRIDYKLERDDTPRIQRWGEMLIRALEGEEPIPSNSNTNNNTNKETSNK